MVIHNTTRGAGKSISRENKATRKAFGQEHAPAVVGKPEHGGLGKAYRADRLKPSSSIFNAPPSGLTGRVWGAMASTPIPGFIDDIHPAQRTTARQEPVALLPALATVTKAEWRQLRRDLARMCGPRPRYIPSGDVIALGPGDKPSPYQPEEIRKWHDKFIAEMNEAIERHAAILRGDFEGYGERKLHHPVWERDNAVQRMQHAAFVFATFMQAA